MTLLDIIDFNFTHRVFYSGKNFYEVITEIEISLEMTPAKIGCPTHVYVRVSLQISL